MTKIIKNYSKNNTLEHTTKNKAGKNLPSIIFLGLCLRIVMKHEKASLKRLLQVFDVKLGKASITQSAGIIKD
ncbi:hypothetical protein ACFL22_00605 [Patescibacteria group bacterium]